ncbi:potassium channel, voltage-dependent, EAG/ELK/ERG [Artemisia annua]|uniref:Potassium channel, voltage-dependent, EAG/ELK/ERG n=1 Tax=Artemisia annua TaxID=35608 RepID=A0A2U1LSV5_ARTAN|nr:potassium channel, voltage-dependent, EAG/ELK/ERG [Artemisia annua]
MDIEEWMNYVQEAALFNEGAYSYTTDGGRANFGTNVRLVLGTYFYGEELLTWALDPRSRHTLALSTRTVTSVSEVEWAACYIESAWKSYRRRKLVGMLKAKENYNQEYLNDKSKNITRLRNTILSLTLSTNIRKGKTFESDDIIRTPVPKPKDPDL